MTRASDPLFSQVFSEAEPRSADARYEDLEKTLKELLYRAVHDLRGPMGQVAALSGLLARQYGEALPAEALALCGHIETASRRAVGVAEAVNAYAHAMEPPVPESLDANHICDAAFAAARQAVGTPDAILRRGELPRIHGDARGIGGLFEELFRNGLKFNRSERPEIRVSAEMHEAWVMFSVLDNGIGIPADLSERVLQPLRRLNGFDFPGAGMGLAICRRTVEAHGGRISVQPSGSGGTVLRFTLPAETA